MKIAFTTLGCKLNFAESSALGKALLERGHTRAKQGEEADICIINTCSVTDTADHKDRQAIHRIRRQNPKAILIVTGCYAQLKPGEIAQIEGVDFVLGQDEKFHLPEFVKRLEDLKIRKFEDFTKKITVTIVIFLFSKRAKISLSFCNRLRTRHQNRCVNASPRYAPEQA